MKSPTSLVTGLFLVLASATCVHAQQHPLSWESRGIGGGGALMDPSLSPHDARLFVACDMSELFRSSDMGRHWVAVNHRQLQGNRGTQVQFTADPDRLYVIDQTGELPVPAVSTDGGVTWSRVSSSAWPEDRTAYRLFGDSAGTQRLIVGDNESLWISVDGGGSFQQRFVSAAANGLHLAGAFFDGQNIYVGTSEGLLVSSNGGQRFTLDATAGIAADAGFFSFAGARTNTQVRLVASVARRSDLYPGVFVEDLFGSAYRGLYRREPGQTVWTAANVGIPANDRPVLVAMATNDIATVVAAGAADPNISEEPVVYKSTNGGGLWASVLHTENNQNIATGWEGAGGDRGYSYGGALIGMAVASNNAGHIAVSDYGFVHVSEDGGLHWRQAYVESADQNPENAPTPTRRSYRSAGIENTSVWSMAWSSAQEVFAGFSDIRGIRSQDAGLSWSFDYTGHAQNSMYRLVRAPGGTLYAATSNVHDMYQSTHLSDASIDGGQGRVLRSVDQGHTWTTVHDFGHVVTWIALDPTNPERAYASVAHATAGGVFVTNNLGTGAASSWTTLGAPPRTQGHPYVVEVLNDGAIVATYSGRRAPGFTASAGLFYKANAAAPWQDRSDPGMQYWTKDVVIDPHDASQNTWYVAVFSGWGGPPNGLGGIYRTFDRGAHWTRINALDRVESITVSPTDADFAFITTETDGLWFTGNLRASSPQFQHDSAFAFRQPLRVFFNPHDPDEVWVTSFGGGLRVGRASDGIFAQGFEF